MTVPAYVLHHLHGRRSLKLALKTYLRHFDDGSIRLTYYDSSLLIVPPDRECVIVAAGGWQTEPARRRINSLLPEWLHLQHRPWTGWVWPDGRQFEDGNYILPSGRPIIAEHPYYSSLMDSHPGLARSARLGFV